ncbi:MAG TPA: hypothetical protein VMX38_06000 [Verrucomicrobiae bacterium]|nr:hypothetical protein [Verrucomicrobiae bacterium]
MPETDGRENFASNKRFTFELVVVGTVIVMAVTLLDPFSKITTFLC